MVCVFLNVAPVELAVLFQSCSLHKWNFWVTEPKVSLLSWLQINHTATALANRSCARWWLASAGALLGGWGRDGQAKGGGKPAHSHFWKYFKKSGFLSDCRYTDNFKRKANFFFLFQIFFTTFAVSGFPLGCDCATLRVTCREQLLHLQLIPQAAFNVSPSDLSCRHVIHPYPDQQKSSKGNCTTLFLPCLGNRQVF